VEIYRAVFDSRFFGGEGDGVGSQGFLCGGLDFGWVALVDRGEPGGEHSGVAAAVGAGFTWGGEGFNLVGVEVFDGDGFFVEIEFACGAVGS